MNTENLEAGLKNEDERVKNISALMKVFRDPDWYDDRFPAFSQRKKELHETEKGVEDVAKEIQLIIEEVADKKIEEQRIEDIRSMKETLNLTTQQAMDALRMSADEQVHYASRV